MVIYRLFLVIALSAATASVYGTPVQVTIYTENVPPYNYVNANNQVVGMATGLVEQIMKESGLSYHISVQPWVRSMRDAATLENTLIYPMVKTDKRGETYEWLVPLFTDRFFLIGHKDDTRPVTIEKIRRGDFIVVCLANDVSCSLLGTAGFPAQNILHFTTYGEIISTFKMMASGRADFYADTLFRYHFDNGGIAKTTFKPIYPLGETSEFYLAAGKHVRADIKNTIKQSYMRLKKTGHFHTIDTMASITRSQ